MKKIITATILGGSIMASTLFFASDDVTATRCGLLESGSFTGRFYFVDEDCPPDPAGKPQYSFLPAPRIAQPAYDPETQVLEGPSYVVGATSVEESWSVRAKTAQELEAEKDALLEGINRAVFLSLCHLKNQIRTKVDGLSEWSEAQCLTAFKGLL